MLGDVAPRLVGVVDKSGDADTVGAAGAGEWDEAAGRPVCWKNPRVAVGAEERVAALQLVDCHWSVEGAVVAVSSLGPVAVTALRGVAPQRCEGGVDGRSSHKRREKRSSSAKPPQSKQQSDGVYDIKSDAAGVV
jgi:hypothetical protein